MAMHREGDWERGRWSYIERKMEREEDGEREMERDE